MSIWKASLVATVLCLGAVSAAAGGERPRTGFLDKVLEGRAGHESRYVVFIPHSYDGKKPFPLILFLHGSGQTGTDGRKQVGIGLGPAIKKRARTFPFIAVFPQSHKGGWGATTADGKRAMTILAEVEKTYKVDARRVYLTGVSMGGAGTWALAAAHPQRWAAIVPVCGGGDPKQAAKMKDVPCWCFHGDADEVVRVKQSRDMIWALRQAGGEPLYHEYPGIGHNCWDRVYATPDLYEWLLEQRRKGKVSAPTARAKGPGGWGAFAAIQRDWLAAPGKAKPGPFAARRRGVGKNPIGIFEGGRLVRAGVDGLLEALELGKVPQELMPWALAVVKLRLDHPRAAWALAEICVSCSRDASPKAPRVFAEAADLIANRFAASPAISHFSEGLGCIAQPRWAGDYEKHLRAILKENRDRLVRCTTHFALASIVQRSGEARQDEAERLYVQFVKDFDGRPRYPASGVEDNLLAEAKAHLDDLRAWPRMLGKPAPEIDGEDLDGRPMKLSSFRGKAVLLSFWTTGRGPCMKLVAHERSLMVRLAGKPFAIVGVNGDSPEALRKALAKRPVPWRSFRNKRKNRDAITQEWKLLGWPTVYLIDHKGIIRKRWIGRPPDEDLDREIEKLVEAVPRAR